MILFSVEGLGSLAWSRPLLTTQERRGLASQEGDAHCAHHSVRDLAMYHLGKVTILNLELSRGLPSTWD